MDVTIKEVLDKSIRTKVDKRFYKDMYTFKLKWLHKSPEYMQFLSSNLTGVYMIAFSSIDDENLMNILGIDPKFVARECGKDKDINTDFEVSPNPIYMTLMYMMHRTMITPVLSSKAKEELVVMLFEIMSYKMLGSMFSRFFSRHTVNINVAKSVYERLSYSYLIKKERIGNWEGVIRHSANSVLKGGIHHDRIMGFKTLDYVSAVNGIQGSFKSVLKYIFSVTLEVDKEKKEGNNGLSTTSIIGTMEDGTSDIKDLNTNGNLLYNGIRTSFENKSDFLDGDLIQVICHVNNKIEDDHLKTTLEYLVDRGGKEFEVHLKTIVEESLEYLRSKNVIEPRKDIIGTLNVLRGYWRGSDKVRDKVKKHISDKARRATKRKTPWFLNALTICVILYVFLKTITV